MGIEDDFNPHARLYVDGSCGAGGDIGAWAAIAVAPGHKKLLWGVDYPTTISRCELRPIIEGLRWIHGTLVRESGYKIEVTSDSEYTVKTLSGVYPDPKKNTDLWAALPEITQSMVVRYGWRERNTLPEMTLCDEICKALRGGMISLANALWEEYKLPEPVALKSLEY